MSFVVVVHWKGQTERVHLIQVCRGLELPLIRCQSTEISKISEHPLQRRRPRDNLK